MYQESEYKLKITQISEFYKFHRNYARVVDHSVEPIAGWHVNKRRGADYKRMKVELKGQGINITTQRSLSSLTDSMDSVEKKSQYSEVLGPLKQCEEESTMTDDSRILNSFCRQVTSIFPKDKRQFAGNGFKKVKNFGCHGDSTRNSNSIAGSKQIRNQRKSMKRKHYKKGLELPDSAFQVE